MGICYIVGAGEDFCPFSPAADDLVIAADGGYTALLSAGIQPDLLIGDFDSLSTDTPIPNDIPHLRFLKEKDETDAYLAFLEGYRRGFRDFVFLACTGGRADHTFANYQMLLAIKRQGARAALRDSGNLIFCIENEMVEIRSQAGTRVSVFAIERKAVGITLDGLAYSLTNGTLDPAFPLGVSNATSAEVATVEVKDGALLVFTEPTATIRPL